MSYTDAEIRRWLRANIPSETQRAQIQNLIDGACALAYQRGQRIANAVETGIADYVRLKKEFEYYKKRASELSAENAALARSNAALRGVITRMKKKSEL